MGKVADFGFTRNLEEKNYYKKTDGKMPVRWTSPEAIGYGRYSTASDVWAYGVTVQEIYTMAKMPYRGWSNQVTSRRRRRKNE